MPSFKTVQSKLAAGFAIGPIVLIIVGWVSFSNTQSMEHLRVDRERAFSLVAQARQVLYNIIDAETNARGYFIAGTDIFLNQYKAAAARVDDSLAALTTLSGDNSVEHDRIRDASRLIRTKMERLRTNVQLRTDKGLDPLIPVVISNKGQDLTDQIQAVIGQVESDQSKIVQVDGEKAVALAQSVYNSFIYGMVISLVIMIAAALYFGRSITRPVKAMIEALSTASAEILSGTTEQAAGMRQQNSAVTETVTTVDEVLQTAEQTAQRASAVSDTSQRAADAGTAGRKAIDDSIVAMGVVKDRTSTVAEGILALAGQAQSISDIVASVNDIAEQINLLSLNAAIEASRAGEHGRGFNVVASEIKILADQSKRATAQVRQILGDIQKATNAAVMVTEQGTKSVSDALKTITEAGVTIQTLAEAISDAAEASLQISASAGQQSAGMRQIHVAMQNINQVSAQNLAAATQSEQAIRHLTDLGGGLRALVAA
jgi:methyl-accepting chemotaxis protein